MISSNVIQRTLRIRTQDGMGTAFVIEVEGRQYVVTARHLAGDPGAPFIRLHHESQWKALEGAWIGLGQADIDIAVFAPRVQIGAFGPVEPTVMDLAYGQDVYFLGFPYGLHGDLGALSNNLPFPLAKKAIVSLMYNDGVHRIFLDGHNNPGFSGGPVAFRPAGSQDFRICSVISSYQYVLEPVLEHGKETSLTYRYNTGIILSVGINHALDLITAQPHGPKVAE